MNYFVVSDIHGCLKNFNEVLEHFQPETQKLVLLGDYIDRGPRSFEVLKRIIEMKTLYPSTIVLYGNHEDLFLKFLDVRLDLKRLLSYLEDDGGKENIESFTGEILDTSDLDTIEDSLDKIRHEIITKHQDIVDFLKYELQHFYETEHILFTHAGYNTSKKNWMDTSNEEFMWSRGHYKVRPKIHHLNVFGHTLTSEIRIEEGEGFSSNPLLITFPNSIGKYLAIDGGCAFGRQLNAVVLDEEGNIVEQHASK